MVIRASLLALVAMSLSGCADEATCPDTGMSMIESDAALVVTEDEHPAGWGQADCSTCHSFPSLHRQGCTPDVDLAQVRAIVEEGGEAVCAGCHGDNGVADGTGAAPSG